MHLSPLDPSLVLLHLYLLYSQQASWQLVLQAARRTAGGGEQSHEREAGRLFSSRDK